MGGKRSRRCAETCDISTVSNQALLEALVPLLYFFLNLREIERSYLELWHLVAIGVQ